MEDITAEEVFESIKPQLQRDAHQVSVDGVMAWVQIPSNMTESERELLRSKVEERYEVRTSLEVYSPEQRAELESEGFTLQDSIVLHQVPSEGDKLKSFYREDVTDIEA